MKNNQENPLFDSQREKSGPETYEKYQYQYHWALHRVLSNHENQNEYAVFVELHEDVVVCDSLDANTAKFEFSQVKTIRSSFTTNQLIKIKKGKKADKNSVLGKLIQSGTSKPFSNNISSLNLVALNGFSLKLKNPKLNLSKITLNDLDDTQLKDLKEAIQKELKNSGLPTNLQFIISDLSEHQFQDQVISCIAKLISSLYPHSLYNPVDIYRLLVDEINRKGVVTYDFSLWNDVLEKKALTSITVTKVINDYTNIKNESKINSEFNEICSEMGLKVIRKRTIKQSFTRYRQDRIANKSVDQIDKTKAIVETINFCLSSGEDSVENLVKYVCNNISSKIKSRFSTEDDLLSAVICEYIMLNDN